MPRPLEVGVQHPEIAYLARWPEIAGLARTAALIASPAPILEALDA